MPRSRDRGWALRIGIAVGFLALLVLVWEGVKFIGGDPWRLGTWEWRPPLDIKVASDLNLPHVWDIFGALAAPVQRNQEESLAGGLTSATEDLSEGIAAFQQRRDPIFTGR